MAKNFKKVGNWPGASRLTKGLSANIIAANTIALRRLGLETERKVVKYIAGQPSVWPQLNDTYRERKIAQGYSSLMLRRTGDYINRITSALAANQLSVFVGVKKGVSNKNGDELWQIGAIMEYGRKGDNRKARPHFRPVHKHMARKIKTQNYFENAVLAYIKKMNGII